MESMTGYAFVDGSSEQFSFSVEIKSLNSKFLEIYVNLPKILRNEENEFTMFLKKYFFRGKIELNIDIYEWSDVKPVNLNSELIEKYYHELKKLHRKLKIEEPLRFESLLGLEGITHRERSSLSKRSKTEIQKVLNQAVKKAIEMRKREGKSIAEDISLSLNEISERVKKIREMSKNLVAEKSELLKKRIYSCAGFKVDDQRMLSEIAILADKLDINEEIVRLSDHFKKFNEIIRKNDQLGKNLDFLSQEIFREINTIGSKTNSSAIAHLVVEAKNHIDKIREQCRNIV